MESFGGSGFVVAGCTSRKKRSNVPRRPRSDSQSYLDGCNVSPLSSSAPLGGGRNNESQNARGSIAVSDGLGNEYKPKKLKLKFHGVTHTVETKSEAEFAYGGGFSATNSSCSAVAQQQKLILQENIESIHSHPPGKGKDPKGVPWKDYSRNGSSLGKEYCSRGKMSREGYSLNEAYKYEPVRKSKRVPKRRNLDVGFDNGDDDKEIRYLGQLNASVAADYECEEERERGKKRRIKVSGNIQMDEGVYANDMEDYQLRMLGKDARKKSRSGKTYDDTDYTEEEEPTSDDEPNPTRKMSRKGTLDVFIEGRKELTLVTRNRALQSGVSLVDLPNGLPPAPPRKQKEKLSEVEQQLKKAEAAQRRRMQSEKAAREAEAEAIRKILGQDSSRKKREEKMKRQNDELAQRKAANAVTLASNTVRWLMGPSGTVVTFSEDIGLPNIFNMAPRSYPPPRETCVGPNCTNAYKYRDSKSKLPLCSLRCYKAIQEKMQPLFAC